MKSKSAVSTSGSKTSIRSSRVGIRLNRDLKDRLVLYAEEHGTTVTQVIVDACSQLLEADVLRKGVPQG